MGILDRFTTIVKANINELLDKAEDPAKMVDQYLVDLTESLADVKRETALFAGVKFFLEADFKTLRIACPAVRRERGLRGVYVEGKLRFVGSRPGAAIGFERCRDEFSVPMCS